MRREELERELDSTADPCEKVALQNRLAWDLRSDDLDRSISLSLEARDLAIDCGDSSGLGRSLRNLCWFHYLGYEYDVALSLAIEAKSHALGAKDESGVAKAANLVGVVYDSLGDYPSALAAYFESLTIHEGTGDREGQAHTLNNIGLVHQNLEDQEKALDNCRRSLSLYEELGSREGQANALNSLGIIYRGLDRHQDALQSYESSLAIYEETGDLSGQAVALNNVGILYSRLGDVEKAIDRQNLSLDLAQRTRDAEGQICAAKELGSLHLGREDSKEALAHLETALALAEEIDSTPLAGQTHRLLSRAWDLEGDLRKALDHFERFYNIERDLISLRAEEQLANLTTLRELERARQEIEDYRRKNSELEKGEKILRTVLSELEQQREEAQAAHREKSDLIDMAAHDMRNPLGVIIMLSQAIQQMVVKESPVGDAAKKIDTVARRMTRLVTNLLESAALDEGAVELDRSKVDLVDLVGAVAHENERRARLKDQTIEIESGDVGMVLADRDRLYEVIDNLVDNALKYSKRGSSVRLALSQQEHSVRLSVADNGPGLSDEDKKMLFRRFQRLTARPTAGEGSTGLGLSIVRRLVSMHGGKVWAESDGPGKGSTFFLEFNSVP